MRLRTTLALALLAALAGTGYYLLEGRDAREAAEAAARRVVAFDAAAVRRITIEKRDERVVVGRDGEGWAITSPEPLRADGAVVDGLLAFVRRLERVRSVEGATDLRQLGLDAPAVRLTLDLAGDDRLTLLLADANPARTGVYATVEGAPAVFIAPAELRRELTRTPYVEQLRDRTLLPIAAGRVRRLEIERAGVRIAVVREDESRWRVERPFRGDGDDGIIRDLLWKIGTARARAVIREPQPLAAYGLDRPHARARIVDDGGARTLTVALNEADRAELYAAVDGVPGVHVADAQLLTDLALEPDALRDRQLLAHDSRQIERITIQYPGGVLVLERGAPRWRIARPEAGDAVGTVVDNLLEVLPNLRYSGVAAATPASLAPYGLDRPRLAVTVDLAGGRRLPTLSVGRAEGGEHFVMVAGRRPVYKVDSRLIRVFPEQAADAKLAPLPEQLKRALERQNAGR